MNKFMKVMLMIVLVFSIATINLDANTFYIPGAQDTKVTQNKAPRNKGEMARLLVGEDYFNIDKTLDIPSTNIDGYDYNKPQIGKYNIVLTSDKYADTPIILTVTHAVNDPNAPKREYYTDGTRKKTTLYYTNGKRKQVLLYNRNGAKTTSYTYYTNGNIKSKVNFNGNKKTNQINYTTSGKKNLLYTFKNGRLYTKYYYNASNYQYRSYRYDNSGLKRFAYDYKTVNGKRVIIKKWYYNDEGKKYRYQEFYNNGKMKSNRLYSTEAGTVLNLEEYTSNGKKKRVVEYAATGKYKKRVQYSYCSNGKVSNVKWFSYITGKVENVKKYASCGSNRKVAYSRGQQQSCSSNSTKMTRYERAIFNEINNWRAGQGVRKLKYDSTMYRYSCIEAQNFTNADKYDLDYLQKHKMDINGAHNHVGKNALVDEQKYYMSSNALSSYGIRASAKRAVESWANSPGHRAAMVNDQWTHMSVAANGNVVESSFSNSKK